MASEKRISVFISYSRDSDEHGRWVAELADRLHQEQVIAIVFDDYDIRPGMSLTKFMERASEVDKILVVLTPSYKTKSQYRVNNIGSGKPYCYFVVCELWLISYGQEAEGTFRRGALSRHVSGQSGSVDLQRRSGS